jgi:site-specific DNA-methyltransferase (adenine-specific)
MARREQTPNAGNGLSPLPSGSCSPLLDLRLADCVAVMREMPDKHFDVAIVDPPYGINVGQMNLGTGKGKRCSKIENRKWKPKAWDAQPPGPEYFRELFRVSKRQIIWGGNYFSLPPSQYFAIWDKGDGMRGRSFAEGEFAWVSDGGTRIKTINPVDKDRIHPTQKPVELYDWILSCYAKPGQRILDTHLGSGSHAIACHYFGAHLTACEIDADYYAGALERIQRETRQLTLFTENAKSDGSP